jgi:cation diffusion facilitator CzcD-associated flavoprotein CzcO
MRVAVLGMGAMGSRMAAALLRAGHAVTVWNRTAAHAQPLVEQGAKLADSPRAAATDAEIVLAMIRDDEASRRVWLLPTDGALAANRRGELDAQRRLGARTGGGFRGLRRAVPRRPGCRHKGAGGCGKSYPPRWR